MQDQNPYVWTYAIGLHNSSHGDHCDPMLMRLVSHPKMFRAIRGDVWSDGSSHSVRRLQILFFWTNWEHILFDDDILHKQQCHFLFTWSFLGIKSCDIVCIALDLVIWHSDHCWVAWHVGLLGCPTQAFVNFCLGIAHFCLDTFYFYHG